MQPTNFETGSPGRLSEIEIIHRLQHPVIEGMPTLPAGIERKLRPAAVLVPLLLEQGQWRLLFTRRTETVQSHKGQVSFPGGAADPEDGSPENTALREAREEIGLSPVDVVVLGQLPFLATVSNYIITPVVAHIRWPLDLVLSSEEVSRAFTIPLDWLAEPAHFEMRPYTRGETVHDVIFFEPFDGEILWGATAWMTVELLRVLRLIK